MNKQRARISSTDSGRETKREGKESEMASRNFPFKCRYVALCPPKTRSTLFYYSPSSPSLPPLSGNTAKSFCMQLCIGKLTNVGSFDVLRTGFNLLSISCFDRDAVAVAAAVAV